MARKRDYKAEYRQRIERGTKLGKSRAVARGHARAEDLGPLPFSSKNRDSVFERALKEMKRGSSLKGAAVTFNLRPEPLRRYVKRSTTAKIVGRRWVIFDLRPQAVWIASKGAFRSVTVTIDDASGVGRYWAAVNRFLESNDVDFIAPFAGLGVRDTFGRYHPFETRPNILRRLDSTGELHFLEIYADVAK